MQRQEDEPGARPLVDGKKLRAIRLRANLTLFDLAERAGVAERTLRGLEAAQTLRPRPATLAAVAGALGVDVAELLVSVRQPERAQGPGAGLESGQLLLAVTGPEPEPPPPPAPRLALELAGRLTRWRNLAAIAGDAGELPAGAEAYRVEVRALEEDGGRVLEAAIRDPFGRAVASLRVHDKSSDPADPRAVLAAQIAQVAGHDAQRRASARGAAGDPPWTHVLAGAHFLQQLGEGDLARARARFERALELAPEHVYAHLYLAFLEWLELTFGGSRDPVAAIARAAEHAEHAVQLDPFDAHARVVVGLTWLSRRVRRQARSAFRSAVELNADLGIAWTLLAEQTALAGSPGLAFRQLALAVPLMQRDPLRWQLYSASAVVQFAAGDLAGSIESAERALQEGPRHIVPYVLLAASHALAGSADAARAMAADARRRWPALTLGAVRHQLSNADASFQERIAEGLSRAGLPD